MARPWDALYARGPPYHGPAPPPFFAAELAPGARVLDLGCGAGKSLRALREAGPGWALLGLDASRAALQASPFPAAQGDAARLPLRSGVLDAVRVHHLLGHLGEAERARAAREAERALRPGGWLEVREFAAGDLRDGTGTPAGPRAFERGGVVTRYFSLGELAALFPRCRGDEVVVERRVRFAARPRRVVELHARRA